MKRFKLICAVFFLIIGIACGGGGSGSSGGGGGGGNGGGGGGGNGGGGSSSYTLTIAKSVATGGTITSSPAGISCDTTCTTQSATFTGQVTLTATANAPVSAVFTGWSGGGCSGNKTCSVTLSADTSINASFVTVSPGQLAWFTVTLGGGGTDYTGVYDSGGNPIDVSSTVYVFSEVIPATGDWVVLDTFTSESWGSWNMAAFAQDGQVFEVLDTVPDPFQCGLTSRFNPNSSAVTSMSLTDNTDGVNSIGGWEMSEIGIVNGNVYYKNPIWWDDFTLSYDIGGEYMMMPVGGKAVTLLSRTDAHNQAVADVADSGNLYGIFKDVPAKGNLLVYARDLTTGDINEASPIVNYDITTLESEYSGISFAINDGIFYIVAISDSDKSFNVTTVPMAGGALADVGTLDASNFGATYGWSVDNGHVDVQFSLPGQANFPNSIADLDTTTGNWLAWTLGTSTQLLDMRPVWIPVTSKASGAGIRPVAGSDKLRGIIPIMPMSRAKSMAATIR